MGILIAAGLIGYLLYFLFFYQAPEELPPEEDPFGEETGFPEAGEGDWPEGYDPETGEPLPPAYDEEDLEEEVDDRARGGVTRTETLNDTPSMAATLSPDGNRIQYYNKNDGKFYRIDRYGNLEAMSDKVFENMKEVTWAPNKSKAVLESYDGSKVMYDFDADRAIRLPGHWEDFDFSPTSDRIVMKSMGMDPDNRWLAISETEGGRIVPIEKIGKNDDMVHPSWSPNHQIIGMYVEGKGFDRQEVFFLGREGENFKSITVEGRDFRPLWSSEGDKLMYSVYSSANDMKPQLWVTDAYGDSIGDNRKSLGLNTWSDKCAFSSNNEVYCGVPEEMPEGAGVFPEMAQDTTDQLYKVNLETGSKQLVATPDQDFNISDIQVSEDGSTLFFTDAQTERIHKIDL